MCAAVAHWRALPEAWADPGTRPSHHLSNNRGCEVFIGSTVRQRDSKRNFRCRPTRLWQVARMSGSVLAMCLVVLMMSRWYTELVTGITAELPSTSSPRSPCRWTCDRAWDRGNTAPHREGVHIHSGCCPDGAAQHKQSQACDRSLAHVALACA